MQNLANLTALQNDMRQRVYRPGSGDTIFYQTDEWRSVRYKALKKNNGRCELCGRSKHDGAILHVDHIEPRSKRPDLELDISNLQVLCLDCNFGKSNTDNTDWRHPKAGHRPRPKMKPGKVKKRKRGGKLRPCPGCQAPINFICNNYVGPNGEDKTGWHWANPDGTNHRCPSQYRRQT